MTFAWLRRALRRPPRAARPAARNARLSVGAPEKRDLLSGLLAFGSESNSQMTLTGRVRVQDAANGAVKFDFAPYGAGYTGPVRVALADVTGDGFQDVITGAGACAPDVRVWDGT